MDPGAYAAQGVCLLSNMLSTARIPFSPKPQWYLVTRSIFPSVDGRFGEGLLVSASTHKTGAGGMSALRAKRKGPIGKPRLNLVENDPIADLPASVENWLRSQVRSSRDNDAACWESGVMKIDGRCHCGYVSFEAEADPETTTICNCTDCQTMSGAPLRAVIITRPGTFVLSVGRTDGIPQNSRQRSGPPAGILPALRHSDLFDLGW